MPEIEHNGPGFKYRVYWKPDVENARWQTEDVVDWEQDHFVVPNQPTFEPYRIKVEAHNDRGEANVAAPEVQGWSGEARKFVIYFFCKKFTIYKLYTIHKFIN